jgi:ubiquinone/menaquinone biosynthesis C-methylase UbiE
MGAKDSRNLQKYPPVLFDEARRREFIDPEALVELVALKGGEQVADFGAGAGFFSIPLARAVGKKGKVYAIDINPNNLSIIRGKAAHEKVASNIETSEANVETGKGLPVKAGSLDVVVLSSVLSQFKNKRDVVAVAAKHLKRAGRLVIFEWHQRDMLLGPSPRARIAKEEVINMLFEQVGEFKLYRDVDAGFYHYCLIFVKQ